MTPKSPRRFACFIGMLRLAFQAAHAFQGQGSAGRVVLRRTLASTTALDSTKSTETTRSSHPQSASKTKSPFPFITLKRSKQSKAFRNGNPLVFTRAIQQVQNPIRLASLAHIMVETDDSKKPTGSQQKTSPAPQGIGFGVYNPGSLYRIRILCHRYLQPHLYAQVLAATSEHEALRLVLTHHVRIALRKRQALGLGWGPKSGGARGDTNVFRLVHGEGDGLSGLAVDMVGPTVAVVMSSAAWCQVHQETITQALQDVLAEGGVCENDEVPAIVWKTTPSRLEQDGYVDDMVPASVDDSLADNNNRPVICMENGIRYHTYPFAPAGQKTGVYCDQRENRFNLAQLCREKRVLDLCCYHGGFGLNAVLNGNASSATLVDSSADAVTAAQQNARLNNCEDKIAIVHSDITSWMQDAFLRNEEFGVVVLDPPKLAPSDKHLDKARRKYHGINRDAIKLVSPQEGGLLMTCTCSAAMTQRDGGQYFLDMVHGAALAAGRQVTLLRVSGAASCHTQSPIAWPAGAYLTAALFYVHPTSQSE